MIIMPRFFVDQQPQDGVLTLTGENAHHAGRVLRLRVGEGVTLCDGAGMDFDCTVETVEKEAVTCRVVSCHAADTEPKQSITLFMALPKGDKMEFIVQKAVELGVSRIVPYLSKNCVSRPDKTEKKVEDLQAQLKELYDKKTELENLEIINTVRAMVMDKDQIMAFLSNMKGSKPEIDEYTEVSEHE